MKREKPKTLTEQYPQAWPLTMVFDLIGTVMGIFVFMTVAALIVNVVFLVLYIMGKM